MISSRMASETWSAILSGCPSVTDSDVNSFRFATYASKEIRAADRRRAGLAEG
jgi:hypothetical protein